MPKFIIFVMFYVQLFQSIQPTRSIMEKWHFEKNYVYHQWVANISKKFKMGKLIVTILLSGKEKEEL